MPLPFAHTAIGIVTHDAFSKTHTLQFRWRPMLLVILLSNLPDVDVIAGLIWSGNGNFFHRGPTHSILFAVLAGYAVAWICNAASWLPKTSFSVCAAVILSHTIADYLFTHTPVSFFWPFEVSWSGNYSGWTDVFHNILSPDFKNTAIIVGCAGLAIIIRSFKRKGYRVVSMDIFKRQRQAVLQFLPIWVRVKKSRRN